MVQTLLMVIALAAAFPGHEASFETDGSFTETSTSTDPGSSSLGTAETSYPSSEGEFSALYRAEELWVDRNHQNAIGNEVAISGNGQGILASWYLNNDRLSRYVISGSGSPLWTYTMPDNDWGMDVSAGYDPIFTGLSGSMGIFAWLTPSAYPSLELPAAGKQDMTDDGGYIVYAKTDGTLVCWNCTADTQEWSTQLETTGNGIYGVEISGDGSRVLVSVYDSGSGAQVYDMTDGTQVGTGVSNYGQTRADISDDGSRIVTGDFYGSVRLYQYSGGSWNLEGSFPTGDSWVTAVSISGDGETAAGGTLAFSPYSGKVVAIDWPSAGSPSVMWEYTDYGDEVSSVDISHDGSVIIAGSWGKYNGTQGDVVTVLDSTGSVIFNLLDDIDEPGSIYSVSVSDDGSFATASGKAVHAREMGSGGEVYGIRIMEAGEHDAAVISISSPQVNLEVGDTVSPTVTVLNAGTSTESFPVNAEIAESEGGTVVWSDQVSVTDLGPGGQQQLTFSDWTVPDYGQWIFTASTDLSGDVYPENDTLSTGTGAFHDARMKSIVCPYMENTALLEMAPMAEVSNGGTYTDSFDAVMEIQPAGGSSVYLDTVTTSSLAPGASQTLQFSPWTPQETGSWQAKVTVMLTDDLYEENDADSIPFETTNEIIYDDGTYETFYWVGTQDDDLFAEKFTPVLTPPMRATSLRLYVNSIDAFEWIAVCPDDGGMPDVENPIHVENDPSVSSPPAWLEIPLDIWWNSTDDLWIVAKWYDAKALAIGTDTDQPVTGRCWWHNRQNGWVNFTTGDFSFRLTMEPETSSQQEPEVPRVFAMGAPAPNPFSRNVSIGLSVPRDDAEVTLSVYDLSGRCVDTITSGSFKAGEHTVNWTPDPSAVSTGVYFVRMEAPGTFATEKVVLID